MKAWMLLALAAATAAPAVAQEQLCPPQKLAALRASLPASEVPDWQKIFDDPTTVLYTEQEMPPAYQHADAGLAVVSGGFSRIGTGTSSTFHSPHYNISGDAQERQKPHGFGGNANIEFPWRMGVAGGTDLAANSKTFKFFWLPKQENGRPYPVIWWREVRGGARAIPHQHVVTAWMFPRGTVFGEVLAMNDSRGQMHTWEVRIRRRESDYWDVDILRPFPTSADLAARLGAEGYGELAQRLAAARMLQPQRLDDRLHRNPAFSATGGVDVLPTLGERLATHLLDSTPFKSALGATWHRGANGIEATAPTSREAFSIVPANYHGTFLGADTDSCRNCHKHTLRHVDEFDSVRQWYGRVRGSDEILSWHPVSLRSISYAGSARQVEFRESFVRGGVLEQYDPRRHPSSMYAKLK